MGPLFYVLPTLRNPQMQADLKWLAEEKREKSESIWDLDPDATEKAEPAFSGQP